MSGEASAYKYDDGLLQELEGFLECIVCYHAPDAAPIYQCDNGHLLCDDCNVKLSICPCCRGTLSNVRNRLAEKILDKIPTGCEFEEFGCDVILPREDLPAHGKECEFREVLCPRRFCDEMISLAHLAEHFGTVHKRIPAQIWKPRGESLHSSINLTVEEPDTPESTWDSKFHFNAVYFFLQVTRIYDTTKSSGNWYIWMYASLLENECDNFVCRLKISTKESEDTLLKIGPVVSIDVDRDEVTCVLIFRWMLTLESWCLMEWEEVFLSQKLSLNTK